MPEETLLSLEEFAAKIKEKYPQYKDVDDSTLVAKMLEKYPEYKDRVDLDGESEAVEEAAPLSFPSATVDVSGESETSLQEEEVAEEEVVEEETEDIVTTGETRDYSFGGGFVGENQQLLPKNEEVVVEDPNPITEEESELLEASINPHAMAMSAIGRDPEADVYSLTPAERDVYARVYSQWQGTQDQQDAVKEREAEKQNNVNRYGIQIEDNSLPGLVPSLSDETTFNPLPGGYNYSDDPEVIAEAETIIEEEMSRATHRFQNIFKYPKDYNLPSDITTATPEELTAAWKIFNKQNNKDKDGFFKREREKHINLKESYLESLFNQQFETSKQQYQDRRDNQITINNKEEIKNRVGNAELTEEDVRSINLSEQRSYDYNNNMDKDEKSYIDSTNKLTDSTNKLAEINKKLSVENLDENTKKSLLDAKTELLIEYNYALKDVTAAKIELGKDKKDYFDMATGQRVEKITKAGQEDLTEEINKEKEKVKTFKGNVEDAYLEAANREEDHRIWGKESSRDIEVKDPTYWRLKGYEAVKLDNGNFQVKNVSLYEANHNPNAILNESVRDEVKEWNEKNRQNIASRHVWKDMALLNIDPGKVETEGGVGTIVASVAAGAGTGAVVGGPIGALVGGVVGLAVGMAPDRFFEVIGEGTIGEELTEKIGMSDRKFVDKAIEELNKEGIQLNQSQIDNMERSGVMEFTEGTAGFAPILAQMWVGNKVLGVAGFTGWLQKTIKGLNNAKKLKRWNKFRGYLLGASVEEAQMQVYGFEKGTGFGFHTFGKFLPAGKLFKFTGEWARLNTVGNMVFESGLKGAGALEFASHVEAIVEDIDGGSEYGVMIREQYPDISTIGRRVLLNAAVFSFYGAAKLAGRGKSGMNIKNMEAVVKELNEKGYKEEASEIQKNVDLYYEGKKELPKEEQELFTKHENGQLKLEFDTDLTEKELADRLKEMGGKEIKPEGEAEVSPTDMAEVIEVTDAKGNTVKTSVKVTQEYAIEVLNKEGIKDPTAEQINKRQSELFEKDKINAQEAVEKGEVKPEGEAEVLGGKQIELGLKELSEAKTPESKAKAITKLESNIESGAEITNAQRKTIDNTKSELAKEGYEIGGVKKGQKLNDGDLIRVETTTEAENLPEGIRVVGRVSSPQISKNGKVTKNAEIEQVVGTGKDAKYEALVEAKNKAVDAKDMTAIKKAQSELSKYEKELIEKYNSSVKDKTVERRKEFSEKQKKSEVKSETTDLSELRKKAEAAMKSKIKTVPIKDKKVEETTGRG